MQVTSKWPARIALLVSAGLVATIFGVLDAYGFGGQFPFVQQTSPSPRSSPSPSVSCLVNNPPVQCRTISPGGGSPTASPTGSPTGGPGGPEKHDSSITIDYGNDKFSGAVKSAKKCKPQREVVVRKVRKGPDPVVGRDTTNRRGKWSATVEDAKGRYFAKVAKRVFTQGSTRVECGGARSKTIRVV
jgi:hypothetical protein